MPRQTDAPTPLCRLAALAREGDQAALQELLLGLQDHLWRFCLSQLGDADAAEDAVQEAAARLIQAVRRFRGRSAAKTWALGIALNVCREKRRAVRLYAMEELTDAPDASRGVADQAVAVERAEKLQVLLRTLPERQREAVVLRYFEQLTVDETAQAMGCAPGTVKAAIWQALRKIRNQLGADHG